jgi:IclR family acetate operon transcriptional repressor
VPRMQIKVLDKAVQIIELLANSDRGIRLTDVRTALSLNKTTVLRILRVLESHNLVSRNGDATFVLGNRVLWWETCYRRNFDLLAVVRPHLEKLRDLTSETSIFSIVSDFRTVIVNQAVSSQVTSSRYDLGAACPLHAGASGKAVLAHLNAEKRKEFFTKTKLNRLTKGTTVDRTVLERQLKEITDTGVAITRGERFETTASVAAPAFGADGDVLGAIAVIGPSERLTKSRLKDIVPLLLQEARLLSGRLSRGARA